MSRKSRGATYLFGERLLKNRYELRGDKVVLFIKQVGGDLPDLECTVDASDMEIIVDANVRLNASTRKLKCGVTNYYIHGYSEKYKKDVMLHRLLTGAPPWVPVDHQFDHSGLNNTRENLRVTTYSENNLNKRPESIRAASGVRGVRASGNGKWRAHIRIDNKEINLGTFDSIEEARTVHEKALNERVFEEKKLSRGHISFKGKTWHARTERGGVYKHLSGFSSREDAQAALDVYLRGAGLL